MKTTFVMDFLILAGICLVLGGLVAGVVVVFIRWTS